jgi:DNA-binding transcriptional ArsR family regulator
MVVDLLADDARADLVFNALADPTRRDIVRRAMQGEHSVSDLAGNYAMSFAAVQKHVAVLQRAGLVTKERRGRAQLVHTDIDAICSSTGSRSSGAPVSTSSTRRSPTDRPVRHPSTTRGAHR